MDIKSLKLGKMKLEGFVKRPDAERDRIKITAIGLGQAGGKMAQEMARLGYFTLLINTAQSDLDDITEVSNEQKVVLPGFGGASKDIARGQKAVEQNIKMVAAALKRKEVLEADFVWVFAGLGGGTGNGGMPTILEGLYNLRKGKQYKPGQPTIGVVAAIPGEWEKSGLKENAVAGVAKLKLAIDHKKVGSVLIVDNNKLYNDYYANENNVNRYMEWEVYGNTTVASMLFEIAVTTSLPASTSLDVSELIDIWSTPGFLAMGKKEFYNEITDNSELIKIIHDSYKRSGVFADEYNFERDSLVGGFIAVAPRNKFITSGTLVKVEEAVNKVLEIARITHPGLIENDIWETTHDRVSKEKCIIYTMAVIATLPKRIQVLVKNIQEAQRRAAEAKKQRESEGSIDLSMFTGMYE
ncbi:MAG: hypothetical protein AB7G87_09175, partial [Clostridia bacterium]